MPLTDVNYVLAAFNVSTTTNGSDNDIRQAGTFEGVKQGVVIEGKLRVTGAIDDATGDETMQIFIEEKIGANYRTIAVFPTIGSAADDNPDVDLSGRWLRCFFQFAPNATHWRWRSIAGGTTPSLTGVEIRFIPLPAGASQ